MPFGEIVFWTRLQVRLCGETALCCAARDFPVPTRLRAQPSNLNESNSAENESSSAEHAYLAFAKKGGKDPIAETVFQKAETLDAGGKGAMPQSQGAAREIAAAIPVEWLRADFEGFRRGAGER